MCKSISIFIIQCPPKIMYICMYIYIIHDMSLGIFRRFSTQQKPWVLGLQSWKKSSLPGLWPATFEGHQHWCLGKSTKMVGKSTNDNQKGGSPRILKTGWTFVEKKHPGLHEVKLLVFDHGSRWLDSDFLFQQPFFDLGKLVTFPNRPRIFGHSPLKTFETWVNLPLSSKDLGNWGTDAKTMHSYLGWEQEFLGQKRRKSSHPRWFWFYQYVPLKTWDNNLQLKQKSPFSWTTSLSFILGPMIWQEDLLERWISILKIFVALSKLCMCLPYTNVPSCPHWRDIRALEFLHEHQDIPSV